MTANPDIAELAPLLSQWGIQVRKPLELNRIPAGLSGANVWSLSHEGHKYCLRRWPTNHPTPAQLRTIHQVIEHVWQAGLKIAPVPHKTLQGDSFVFIAGHLWELAAWLPGQPLSSHASNEQQRIAAIKSLARFHQAAATFGNASRGNLREPAPGLLTRRDLLADLLKGRLAELSKAVRDEPPTAARETLLRLLNRIEHALPDAYATVEHCAKIPLPMQWCLRDVHPGNVLVKDNQVTGIVDFGAVARDSVAGDIARLVGGFQCNPENSQEYVRIYARLRPLTNDEQRAITAYHVGGLISSAANWIRWLCVERSVPLDNTTLARVEELAFHLGQAKSWRMERMGGI